MSNCLFAFSSTTLLLLLPIVALIIITVHVDAAKYYLNSRENTGNDYIVANPDSTTNTFNFNSNNIAPPESLSIRSVLQYGQTLVIDGIRNNNGGGSIDVRPFICPGSKIVVKNCDTTFIVVAQNTDDLYRENCHLKCNFPANFTFPDDEQHRMPFDVEPSLVTHITIEGNKANRPKLTENKIGSALSLMLQETFACAETSFNNTRYSLNISNNIFQSDDVGVTTVDIPLLNAELDSDIDPSRKFLRYTFVRNFYFINNIVTIPLCARLPASVATRQQRMAEFRDRYALLLAPFWISTKDHGANLVNVRAEGLLSIEDNTFVDPCYKPEIVQEYPENDVYNSRGLISIRVSDFGANPDYLPLRFHIRRNSFAMTRAQRGLDLPIHTSRLGYFRRPFSSIAGNKDSGEWNQLDFYSNLEEAQMKFPQVIIEENRFTYGYLVQPDFDGLIKLAIEQETSFSPQISQYVRDFGSSPRAFTSDSSRFPHDDNYLYLLKYYPERIVYGPREGGAGGGQLLPAVIIKNNTFNYHLPVTNEVLQDSPGFVAERSQALVQINNIPFPVLVAMYKINEVPYNKNSPYVDTRALPEPNMSSFLYTLSDVIIEKNVFEIIGSRRCRALFFGSLCRMQTSFISDNTFDIHAINQGNPDPRQELINAQSLIALEYGQNSTIHRVLIVFNKFSFICNNTATPKGVHEAAHWVRIDRLFGIVQFAVRLNSFFFRSTTTTPRCAFLQLFANYFEDLYHFPFVHDEEYFSSSSSSGDQQFESTPLSFQSRPRTWEVSDNIYESDTTGFVRNFSSQGLFFIKNSSSEHMPVSFSTVMFPGGTLLINNLTFRGILAARHTLIAFTKYEHIEVDRFIISNIDIDTEVWENAYQVSIEAPLMMVRKLFQITNITCRLRALYYGVFDSPFNTPDTREFKIVKILPQWVDVYQTTLVDLPQTQEEINPDDDARYWHRSPFALNYEKYLDKIPGEEPARSVMAVEVDISNFDFTFGSGIVLSASAIYMMIDGLKVRDDTVYIRNVTARFGRFDGRTDLLPPLTRNNPLTFSFYQNFVHRRSFLILATASDVKFQLKSPMYSFTRFRDPRFEKFFPYYSPSTLTSSSTTTTTPNNLTIEDCVALFDHKALGNVFYVEKYDTANGEFHEIGPPIVVTNALPNSITFRRFRTETFKVDANQADPENLFLTFKQIITVPLVGNVPMQPSFLYLPLQLDFGAIEFDQVFAPAFAELFTHSDFSSMATTGVSRLRFADLSETKHEDDFLSTSIQNYVSDRQLSEQSRRKIYNDFTVGRCTAFLGNRPLSSFDRIFQSMSPAPPLNKGPFESGSSGAFRSQVDFTPCLNETKTITLTKTITRSKSVPGNPENISYTPSLSLTQTATYYEIPPPPPFVLPGQEEGAAMLAAAALAGAVAVSITPSAAAAVARMTSVLDVVNGIAKNDCTGQSADEAPDLVSSPFQISFGPSGGGYLLGTVVGNMLLNAVLFLLTLTGYWLFLRFYRKKQRLQVPFLSMKGGALARFLRDSLSFTGLVVGTEILLYPTLAAGLVMTVRNHSDSPTSFGARAVAAVLTGGVSVVCVSWLWKLLKARDSFEKFKRTAGNRELMSSVSNNNKNKSENSQRLLRRDDQEYEEDEFALNSENSNTSCVGAVWNKVKIVLEILTGEEGVWYFPSSLVGRRAAPSSSSSRTSSSKETEHTKSPKLQSRIVTPDDKYLWYYAEPLIEGFTDRFPRFMAVEFGVQGLLAVAIAVGEVIGAGRSGCVVQAGFVLLIFFLYLVATMMWRPYNDLLSRVTTPATTIIELITIVIALMDVEIAALSGLVVALSSMQMIVAVVSLLQWVIAVGWPAFRAVVLRGRNRKSRSTSAAGERNNTRVSMSMRTFSNARESSATRPRHPSSAVSSRTRSGSTRGDEYYSSSNRRSSRRNTGRDDEELLVNDVLMRQTTSPSSRQRRERPGTQSTSDGRRDRSQNSNDDQARRRSSRRTYNDEKDDRHSNTSQSNEERPHSSSTRRNRQATASSSSPQTSLHHHRRRPHESRARDPNSNRQTRQSSSKNTASQMRYVDI